MTEFDVGGQTYRVAKLDAFRQFHVSRRIAPIIPTLVPLFVKLAREGSLTNDIAGLSELLVPFAEGIANMSDEASEYLIANCLSVAQRKNGTGWAPVWNTNAKACMFDDMDLGIIMQIVMKVIQDSLGPFIQGLLTSQQSGPTAVQAG